MLRKVRNQTSRVMCITYSLNKFPYEILLFSPGSATAKCALGVEKTDFAAKYGEMWQNIWQNEESLFPLHRFKVIYSFKNITIMSEIEARVKAIIVDKLGVDESEVTPNASFTNDLGADSLDTVELIMELEKEFGISIPDDQAENISTVQDAVDYIANNAK